jgi:hypothetical protein
MSTLWKRSHVPAPAKALTNGEPSVADAKQNFFKMSRRALIDPDDAPSLRLTRIIAPSSNYFVILKNRH